MLQDASITGFFLKHVTKHACYHGYVRDNKHYLWNTLTSRSFSLTSRSFSKRDKVYSLFYIWCFDNLFWQQNNLSKWPFSVSQCSRFCKSITLYSVIYNHYQLKEYYVIVGESRPLSAFFPQTCWFFSQKCISNHETKQSSKFQSDPSLKYKLLTSTVYFLSFLLFFPPNLYLILPKFWSVLTCDILGIGLF